VSACQSGAFTCLCYRDDGLGVGEIAKIFSAVSATIFSLSATAFPILIGTGPA